MIFVSANPRSQSATVLQRHNVDEFDSPIPISTRNIKLHVATSPLHPAIKPRKLKVKKRIANQKSVVPQVQSGLHGVFQCIQEHVHPVPASSSSSFPQVTHTHPCEHALNDFPQVFRGSTKDFLFQRAKNLLATKYSRKEVLTPPNYRHLTPEKGTSVSKSNTGLGCFPKAERVSVAPNSKANSSIYKNEYKSLPACNDINQMANLQKSRDLVLSANSPSRLRELMKKASNSQSSFIRITNDRHGHPNLMLQIIAYLILNYFSSQEENFCI
jgi:hypothetical protein